MLRLSSKPSIANFVKISIALIADTFFLNSKSDEFNFFYYQNKYINMKVWLIDLIFNIS